MHAPITMHSIETYNITGLSCSFLINYESTPANGYVWYMAKMKIDIFVWLMQNCIELYELLMPC